MTSFYIGPVLDYVLYSTEPTKKNKNTKEPVIWDIDMTTLYGTIILLSQTREGEGRREPRSPSHSVCHPLHQDPTTSWQALHLSPPTP